MADEQIADLTVGPPGAAEIDAELNTPLEDDPIGDVPVDLSGVDPSTVRVMLAALSSGVHVVAGHEEIPDHWKATDDELDQASAALARIASRSPVMARAMSGANGDGIALAIVGGQYVVRNVAATRALEQEDDDGREHEDGHGATSGPVAGPPIAGLSRPAPDGAGAGAHGPAAG